MSEAPAENAATVLGASVEESTSSTGTNLGDLPTDILLDILELFTTKLPQSGDTQSPDQAGSQAPYEYQALSQVCRQLRVQLLPAVYRDIRLGRMSLSASLSAVMHATTEMTQYCQVRTLHMTFAEKEELPPGSPVLGSTALTHYLQDLSLLSPQDTMNHSVMTRAIIDGLDPCAPMFPCLTTLALETISFPDLVQLSRHCPLLERLTIAFSDWKSDIDQADLLAFPNLDFLSFRFNHTAGYLGLSNVLAASPKITVLHLIDRMVIRSRLPQSLSLPALKHFDAHIMYNHRDALLDDTLMDLGLASVETLTIERDGLGRERDCMTKALCVGRFESLRVVGLRWNPSVCQDTKWYHHEHRSAVLQDVYDFFDMNALRRLPSLERFWCSDEMPSPPVFDPRLMGCGTFGTITEYGREEAQTQSVIRLRCLIQSRYPWLCWTANDRLTCSEGWLPLPSDEGRYQCYWRDYWYLGKWPLPDHIARKLAFALGAEKEKGWVEGNRNLELTDAARKLIQERQQKR